MLLDKDTAALVYPQEMRLHLVRWAINKPQAEAAVAVAEATTPP
jgi:hypothetical protein